MTGFNKDRTGAKWDQPTSHEDPLWDFGQPSIQDSPLSGGTTVEVGGPGGRAFQIEDVDTTAVVGSGVFARDAYRPATTTALEFTRRYWVRDLTESHPFFDRSCIFVPKMETGTPQSLPRGREPYVAAAEPFVDSPYYRLRVGGCAFGDTCGALVGIPGVSTIATHPDGSAGILNPIVVNTTTATYLYPKLPGAGSKAEIPFPIPNDPNLSGQVFYFQVAVWDRGSQSWKFSAVCHKRVWLRNPLDPATAGRQSPTSSASERSPAFVAAPDQNAIACRQLIRTLVRDHGFSRAEELPRPKLR